MLNADVEGPGRRVPLEANDMAAADPGQPAGPSGQARSAASATALERFAADSGRALGAS